MIEQDTLNQTTILNDDNHPWTIMSKPFCSHLRFHKKRLKKNNKSLASQNLRFLIHSKILK